ncbi:beta-glucuronidase LacZ4 [Bacteroides sedimenti]|uniref:Beta-galactosidase n=1 Tax=Bacteroides sedimenti TaxID=2136147 RepID=A0ABN6ZA14_9BACE
MRKFYLLCLTTLVFSLSASGSRIDLLLNDNWSFRFSHNVSDFKGQRVDLPHTWNTVDALSGKLDYKRGIGNYEKKLFVNPEWKGKRLFLRFEGVNTIANVLVNGKHIGEHRGGYSAFVFEITDRVNYGKENTILVRVNNAEQLDVMPLVGDFNFYGGIYRDVHLLITDPVCISPLDYASPGVYLIQESVSNKEAKVKAKIILSNGSVQDESAEILLQIWDGNKVIRKEVRTVNLKGNSQLTEEIPFIISRPHLWNGMKDPFMYRAEISLIQNNREIDKVNQPLGLRYFHVDPQKGFFLNGEQLKLHGVCRHQDRSEIGNALHKEDHDEDVAIMREMGVNAIRLSHYPHATYLYDLLDRNGFIIWSEIPFVGPGGYNDKGFVDQPAFKENGKEQLKEMIRQNYNHPSVCCWGMFNELKEQGDNPVEYVKELNALAHSEDPTRPTTAASNQEGNLNLITDLIAWNRYDGWYGGMPKNLGDWLDNRHKSFPDQKIGISEYGAGASIYHQQDTLTKTVPNSWWHPENWQTFYHMENWKVIAERPFIWGSFVWNMFDFGAAHRTEGDKPGRNDKGLVTFDRKVRKDAFYFYKANWNKEAKTLYLCNKRNTNRHRSLTDVMVFTNVSGVELFVNGKSMGKKSPDNYATICWKDIKLNPGENLIEVRSTDSKVKLTDSCSWVLEMASGPTL